MPQYLSTDPHAGAEAQGAVYLSTDPEAGMEEATTPPIEAGAASIPGVASGATAFGLGTMAAAPAIIGTLHSATQALGPTIAKAVRGSAGVAAPLAAYGTARKVLAGDLPGAAQLAGVTAGSAAAAKYAPRVVQALERATSPRMTATRNALGRFMSTGKPAGMLARGAGALSRLAGAVSGPALAFSAAYDLQQHWIDTINDPATPPEERAALTAMLNRSSAGSRSR